MKRSPDFKEPLTQEQERALFHAFYGGDDDAGKKIVEHNLRMVANLVFDHCLEHQHDEAFSAGVEALVNLVSSKTFDCSKCKFITYAYHFVRGAVLQTTRVKDAVRFPSKQNAAQGSYPTWEDDPHAVGNWDLRRHLTVEAAEQLHLLEPSCVDQPSFDFDSLDHTAVRQALAELSGNERRVIEELYLGDVPIHGGRPDVSEASRRLGLSRQHVHALHSRVLTKLRAKLEGQDQLELTGILQMGKNYWLAQAWRKDRPRWREYFTTQEAAREAREKYLREEAA